MKSQNLKNFFILTPIFVESALGLNAGVMTQCQGLDENDAYSSYCLMDRQLMIESKKLFTDGWKSNGPDYRKIEPRTIDQSSSSFSHETMSTLTSLNSSVNKEELSYIEQGNFDCKFYNVLFGSYDTGNLIQRRK